MPSATLQYYQDVTGQWWSLQVNPDGSMTTTQVAAPVNPVGITPTIVTGKLVAGAMRLIGCLGQGETPTDQEMSDCIDALNAMMDSWSLERGAVYTLDHPEFALVAGQQDYTIGPGGDWNMYRPNSIELVVCRILSNPSVPYDVPVEIVDDARWAAITVKSVKTPLPTMVHIHGDYPLQKLSFYPIPSVANHVLLWAWQQLGRVADENTELVLPPGYERSMRYGLALEIAPEFGKAGSQEVAHCFQVYQEAKANIKRINRPTPDLSCDTSLIGSPYGDPYAIYRG